MDKYKYLIGIDVAKSKLDVCLLEGKNVLLERCIDNTPKALAAFAKQLQKMDVLTEKTLFCCEHTGIYTSNLMSWSAESGYKLWIEKAIQIKKSIGMQRGKNDKIDAYRIATYAFRYQDEAVIFERPRKVIEELKHLLTTRQRLLKVKKQLQVPLNELQSTIDKSMYQNIVRCSKGSLRGVENDLKKIDVRIQQIIKQDQKLSKSFGFAKSVDGVGNTTAISIIVATNELKTVKSGKELACYAGVVPFTHQSGSSILGKERVSHLSNKPLKTLLYMCAISAKKNSEEFRQYYDRKIAEGKHPMSILNAIKNKIVQRVYACVKRERMYEKNYSKLVA